MRNYWSLLPAIAVCVALILLYAIPTLINPQWTSTVLALFRQTPDGTPEPAETPGTTPSPGSETGQALGALGPNQIRSRRMLAGMLVLAALALVGFNVSLNREANGCYRAAKAFGAQDSERTRKDPCINMIFGEFFGGQDNDITEDSQQPIPAYQPVRGDEPRYLTWIQNRPKREGLAFVVGVGLTCEGDLRVQEKEDKIVVLLDSTAPCPVQDSVSLAAVKLKKPLGDRKIVTVGDKPMEAIHPDMDSWPTVLKKLATGG